MTLLSLDSSTISSELEKIMASNSNNNTKQAVSQVWSIPRINLRKRPCAAKMTNLESVNSAFLSGLFADVAKVAEIPSEDPVSHQTKKIRTSKSIARCDRSFAFLKKALNDASASAEDESCANSNTAQLQDSASTNSLQYQLDCVTSSSSSSTATSKSADISSATGVVFPNLPATISNSSCGNSLNLSSRHPASSPITTLTHVISDLQSSNTEKTSQTVGNDTYGWFVEMEEDETATANAVPTLTSTSCLPLVDPYFAPKDLAFTAQVAPKSENYDAELEWATAADTVDDVLGCFF